MVAESRHHKVKKCGHESGKCVESGHKWFYYVNILFIHLVAQFNTNLYAYITKSTFLGRYA